MTVTALIISSLNISGRIVTLLTDNNLPVHVSMLLITVSEVSHGKLIGTCPANANHLLNVLLLNTEQNNSANKMSPPKTGYMFTRFWFLCTLVYNHVYSMDPAQLTTGEFMFSKYVHLSKPQSVTGIQMVSSAK